MTLNTQNVMSRGQKRSRSLVIHFCPKIMYDVFSWTLGGPVYIAIVLVDLDLLIKVIDPFSYRNSENKFVISGPILTKLHTNGLL